MSDFVTYPEPTVLEIYRDLPGPIERVWDYLTKSELRQKWLCAGDVSPQSGGEVVFDFDHSRLSAQATPTTHEGGGKVRMVGEVRVYDRPSHLAFSWPSGEGEAPAEVIIRLTQTPNGVRLHLRHEKVFSTEYMTGASAGWHAHLDILQDQLTGSEPRDFWLHYLPLEETYRDMQDAV